MSSGPKQSLTRACKHLHAFEKLLAHPSAGDAPGVNLLPASISAGGYGQPGANSSNQTPAETIHCLCAKPSAPYHPPQLWLEVTPLWTCGPGHWVVQRSPGPYSTFPWLPSSDSDALQVI